MLQKIDMEQISSEKMHYAKGMKFQLEQDFKMFLPGHPSLPLKVREGETLQHGPYITISPKGWLYLDRGYTSNGADYAIDTSTLVRAFFVHDALLQVIGAGKLDWEEWKPYTDALFTAISKKDGVSFWRRWYQSRAVRKLGRKEGSITVEIKEAP